MILTNIAPCHDQVSVDVGRRVARYSFWLTPTRPNAPSRLMLLERTRTRFISMTTRTVSVEALELRIDSVVRFNSHPLDHESAPPHVTQNDIGLENLTVIRCADSPNCNCGLTVAENPAQVHPEFSRDGLPWLNRNRFLQREASIVIVEFELVLAMMNGSISSGTRT